MLLSRRGRWKSDPGCQAMACSTKPSAWGGRCQVCGKKVTTTKVGAEARATDKAIYKHATRLPMWR